MYNLYDCNEHDRKYLDENTQHQQSLCCSATKISNITGYININLKTTKIMTFKMFLDII